MSFNVLYSLPLVVCECGSNELVKKTQHNEAVCLFSKMTQQP